MNIRIVTIFKNIPLLSRTMEPQDSAPSGHSHKLTQKPTGLLPSSEMSFLDHLEALRWHLVRSSVAIAVFAVLAFIFKEIVFDAILFAPKKSSFITYKVLCALSDRISQWVPLMVDKGSLCITQEFPKLQNISMAGQFSTHIIVSLVAGLVCAFPYILWELWRFVKPALKKTEKNYTRGIVFYSSVLFLAGILFGYYVITPVTVNFFFTYSVSDEVINVPTLSAYISTVTMMVLASGGVFELPLLVYFLTKADIVTPGFLRKYRKHAIVIIFIVAAILTPPDVFSQLLLSFPLLLLYELSIFISAFAVKKRSQ